MSLRVQQDDSSIPITLRDARLLAEQALSAAVEAGNSHGALTARRLLANIAFNQCEDEKSRAMHEELLAECRTSGFGGGVASSLANLALIDIVQGKPLRGSQSFSHPSNRTASPVTSLPDWDDTQVIPYVVISHFTFCPAMHDNGSIHEPDH